VVRVFTNGVNGKFENEKIFDALTDNAVIITYFVWLCT